MACLSRIALAPDAGPDALHGGAEVVGGDGEGGELMGSYAPLEVAQVYRAAHANQGRLAAQSLEVGARVAAGVLGYVPQVQVGGGRHVARVDLQYVQPCRRVGEPDLDLVVEAPRTPEGRVEGRRAVRRSDDADASQIVEPVHEGEELGDEGRLEALAHHVARGGEGVNLVEEDDGGRLGACLVEDGAQPRLALAPILVEDLRPRDGYEVGPALVRHGPRQKGLARPGRSVEQNTFVRPYVELPEDLRVGYGEFDRLPDQGYRIPHPADVLVAGGGHVAGARRDAARGRHPGTAAAHAARETLYEALPLLLGRRFRHLAPFARLDHGPVRERAFLLVAPAGVLARLYRLGEAGSDLGRGVEVEDGAPDARTEVGEHALGDRLLVHLEGAVLAHLAEGVPGVVREVVVVVEVDLLAREELLVREPGWRAPVPRRRPGALLAQKAAQAVEELFSGKGLAVGHVLGPTLPTQEPGEIVEELPVSGEVQLDGDTRRAVHPLHPVGGMPGGDRGRPAQGAVGTEGETYRYLHGPQILTHGFRRRGRVFGSGSPLAAEQLGLDRCPQRQPSHPHRRARVIPCLRTVHLKDQVGEPVDDVGLPVEAGRYINHPEHFKRRPHPVQVAQSSLEAAEDRQRGEASRRG